MNGFASFIGLLILLACVGGWIYSVHPEYYQSALAEMKSFHGETPATTQVQPQEIITPKESASSPAPQAPVVQAPAPSPEPVVENKSPSVYVAPDPLPAKPDWTWTTTEGKVYNKVVIKHVEADCVTILDDEGGGRIDMAILPPDIQKLLNYDPVLAKKVADQRINDAKQSERAQAEALADRKNTEAAHAQLVSNQQPPAEPGQAQTETSVQSAQDDADRRGQIADYNIQIAEMNQELLHQEDLKIHDFQDYNPQKIEAEKEKLARLNHELQDLMQQEADYKNASAQASP